MQRQLELGQPSYFLSYFMKIQLLFRPAALVASLSLLLLSPACTYEEAPPCVLETTEVHYQADIVPILNAHCMKCHSQDKSLKPRGSADGGGGGYNYDTDPTKDGFTQFQNKALDGTLIKVLEQKDKSYQRTFMPLDNPKLSACDIERIKLWVKAGALKD